MDKQLRKLVNKLRIYLFGQSLLKNLLIGLIVSSSISFVIAMISIFIPWYEATYWEIGIITVVLTLAIFWSIIKYPSKKQAALKLDRTGFEERFLTAIELCGDDSFFSNLQKKDALKHLEGVSFFKRLPISISFRQVAICFTCVVCMLLATLWPSKAKIVAEERHEIKLEVEEIIEKIEKLEPDISKDEKEELSEIDKELLEQYEEIKRELEKADTKEDLDKATQRGDKKLQQLAQKAENTELKEQFQQMSASLSGDMLPANGEQLAELEKIENQLKEELDNLANGGELNSEQLEEIIEQMKDLADKLDNSELGESADNLSESIQQSQDKTPSADQLAQATQSVQQAISQSQNQNNQGNQDQANGGQNGENGNRPGENGENGDTSAEGNGGGEGQEGNSGGQNEGNGNGEGNGSGPGGVGGGWNYGSNIGSEDTNISFNGEQVSIPNEVGNDENLSGKPVEGDSSLSEGGPSLTWSGTSVDYEQVLGDYSDKAYAQIEGDSYPASIQDVIKAYFEELNK